MNERAGNRQQPAARGGWTLSQAGRARLAAGLALVVAWWMISWLQWRPLSDHYFFPLWLGYILTVDALTEARTGTSPMRRSGWRVALLFLASVPLWWTFEVFNKVVENWTYHLPREYSTPAYVFLASLAFSTVVPAVLTTCELARSFRLDPLRSLPAIQAGPRVLALLSFAGLGMLALTVAFPRQAFPLVWLSLIFVLDPVVTVLGGRSIATYLRRGDWSPVANLGVATLVCGFFWEMWNVRSMPKWTYDIPYVDWLPVFEMPALGYGGYIPFGVEVFIVYALARALTPSLGWPEARVSSREKASPV